jgi:hypothetical protein
MLAFMESNLGQLIARNGILAVILAWALWSNHGLQERLFVIIENNTKAFLEVKAVCGEVMNGR